MKEQFESPAMKDFEKQLGWLVEYEVDFVVIGGVAAAIYGSSIVTHDLDICYARTAPNLEKLAVALGKSTNVSQ